MKVEVGEIRINTLGESSGVFMAGVNKHWDHSHEAKRNAWIGKVSGRANLLYGTRGALEDGNPTRCEDRHQIPRRLRGLG